MAFPGHSQENDRPLLEALEPRLLLNGQIDYVEVFRCIDYEQPGPGDDEYEYDVVVEDEQLTGLQLTTPWGQEVDSGNYLPPGWTGEEFEEFFPAEGFSLEAGTDEGHRFIYIEWDYLPMGQWESLDTGATNITAVYAGGSWTGSVDFSQVDQPIQELMFTYPIHGQMDVPLLPTIRWQPWDVPPIGDGIEVSIRDVQMGEELYGAHLPPDDSEWTVPDYLEPGTEYDMEVDSYDLAVVNVNGVNVDVRAETESDVEVTTVEAGVMWVEVGRAIDFETPGDPSDDAYSYTLEPSGSGLTRLQLTTAWGEQFDSQTFLGPDWRGEHFEYDDGRLSFEAGTGSKGRQYFDVEWDGLTIAEWADVFTYDAAVTVSHLGGNWTGAIDFSSVTQPTQQPVLTSPVHGETDVPLWPTIEWEPWLAPRPGGGIEVELNDQASDTGVFWDVLAGDATEWTVPGPLVPGTDYEVELMFFDEAVVPMNGIDVVIWAETKSDPWFTTAESGVAEVSVERAIDYETPYLSDDGFMYSVEVSGYGVTHALIITPWGESADTDDLLPPDWSGLDEVEVTRGALELEVEVDADSGLACFDFDWRWLSDSQWADLDSGQTSIAVTHGSKDVWSQTLDFTDVVQHDREPRPTSPTPRKIEPGSLTVEWPLWADAPAGGSISLDIWEIPPDYSWRDEQYAEEARVPASATSWTPPPLPDSDGIFQIEIEFSDMHHDTADGVGVHTVAYTQNDIYFVVGGPEMSLRSNPVSGRSYFLTSRGSWEGAQAFAEAHDAELVTIRDADLEAWLQGEYGMDECFWIGFNDIEIEGAWEWVSGEPVTYTNWAPGEPGDWWEDLDRAVMNWPRGDPWAYGEAAQWCAMPFDRGSRGIAETAPGVVPDISDDHGNTAAEATPMTMPGAITGWLSYWGDIDFFSFHADAGQTYDLRADPPPGQLDLDDSRLWLYDTDGRTLLTRDDDGGTSELGSRIVWTAPATGTYYLAVDPCDLCLWPTDEYVVTIAPSALTPAEPLAVMDHPAEWLFADGDRAVARSERFYFGGTSDDDEAVYDLLDMTDPLAPVEIGAFYCGDVCSDHFDASAGVFYYVDSSNEWTRQGPGHSELVAMDVSGEGDPTELYREAVFGDYYVEDGIDIADGYLYAAVTRLGDRDRYLDVYEILDPAIPPTERVGRCEIYGWGFDVFVYGDRAYLRGGLGDITIVDVSDPTDPFVAGQFEPDRPREDLEDLVQVGDTLLVSYGWSLRAYDVSDPGDVSLLATVDLDGRADQMVVCGDLAFVGCVQVGGYVVDISDPARPQVLYTYVVPGATGSLAIHDGRVYVPTFGSQTVILFATLEGDVNLDGKVNFLDYLILKSNLGTPSGGKWADGDFDADGDVDRDDFAKLRGNFGRSLGPPAPMAPAHDTDADESDPVGPPAGEAGQPDGGPQSGAAMQPAEADSASTPLLSREAAGAVEACVARHFARRNPSPAAAQAQINPGPMRPAVASPVWSADVPSVNQRTEWTRAPAPGPVMPDPTMAALEVPGDGTAASDLETTCLDVLSLAGILPVVL
ncbi:MAG: pre-peptidase C-terminal domain-containing protein [Phycisphaerae bacterium]